MHSLYLYLNHQHIKSQKLSDAEIIYGGSDPSSTAQGNLPVILLLHKSLKGIFVDQLEIGELALQVWQSNMIWPLGHQLVKLLLEAIDLDRAGKPPSIPLEAVRGTILSFVEVQIYKKKSQLQLYIELFEQPFLNASGEHFKRDVALLLQEKDVSLYMERVKAKIEEELFRARRFLHSSSLPKVQTLDAKTEKNLNY